MTNLLALNIFHVLPEVIVAIGMIVLLLLGVFKENLITLITRLAIAILAVAGWQTLDITTATATSFHNHFITNGFVLMAKLIVLSGGILTLILALGLQKQPGNLTRKIEFPVLILGAILGMMMMISSGNFLVLYLGLELQSLCLYILAAFDRDHAKSSEAGLKYFMLGALASGFMLFGISLIYGFTGTIEFGVIQSLYKEISGAGQLPIGVLVGLIMLLIGLAFKVSAAPFHMWTPDVYEGSPTIVTAFFSTTPKVAALCTLVRVLYVPFGSWNLEWQQIITVLAIASMFIGAISALRQTNMKRLLAYSSISHVGYILIGLAAGTPEGIKSILIYVLIYLLMSIGMFAAILCVRDENHRPLEEIKDYAGLSKHRPLLAAGIAIFMFSMAGIPPLAGFFGKFYVLMAALHSKLYILAVLGIIASVISAFYYLKIVKLLYFDQPIIEFSAENEGELTFVATLAGALNMFFFISPTILIGIAEAAAHMLLS